MSNALVCDYEYTCPYCGKTDCVSSSNQAPSVGDIEVCRFCNKGGKISYAKIIFEAKEIK